MNDRAPIQHSPAAPRVLPHPGAARLPDALAPLTDIAWNLWWSWTPEARALFERLDGGAWARSGHNPVKVLLHTPAERLAEAAADGAYVAEVRRVHAELTAYLASPGRLSSATGAERRSPEGFRVAYFCAEYGLTECLPIYCGGLGLLAGDHLKSASDLGLPFVAVGLLYSHGYFRQHIDHDGAQHEHMPSIEPEEQPIRRVADGATGRPLTVFVELPGRAVHIAIWRCDVGRVPLYLLDTDLPENADEDRHITRNLYLGDHHQRIKQEIVLGIGGVRALGALGERPTVFHMNEGHSAFLALERISQTREASGRELSFDQVREAAAAANLFTTHTPVPAGIDRFDPELVKPYFTGMLAGLGLDTEGFLALGRENVADPSERFSMAVLAIRTSRFCNGVSRLHGEVSRRMWREIWPGIPAAEAPIGHVTNGVHMETWLSPELGELYQRYLSEPGAPTTAARWRTHPDDGAAWKNVDRIPDAELWAARESARTRLVAFARSRIAQRMALPAGDAEHPAVASILSPRALTIGFARRFAAYKRATLLFSDPLRLKRLLGDEHRPVQLLIAGKAHPGDFGGKAYIRQIVEFARREGLEDRLLFLEDYDILVARHLVQGCDIWLNNPIRGLEASGTSGMKAALNGVVSASILDGWWDEAYTPEIGYAIGGRSTLLQEDPARRDQAEALALYHLLEEQIVPEFFDRGHDGVPRTWLARVKRCIAALAPAFSTHRMVAEYAEKYYLPANAAAARLSADGLLDARQLSDKIDRYRAHWRSLRILSAAASGGAPASVEASVRLDGLAPEEVVVQVYAAEPSMDHQPPFEPVALRHVEQTAPGVHRYALSTRLPESAAARSELRVRILPDDPRMITRMIPGLVLSEPLAVQSHGAGDGSPKGSPHA